MKRSARWLLGVGAGLGLVAAFNRRVGRHLGLTPRAVAGEPRVYPWREGTIFYEVAGAEDAPPLLLAHGFYAASGFELRRIFHLLADNFRVYMPDLLGFGLSDRPDVEYTSDLYVDLWCDFARDVIGRPASVVASSLSCAHVVAACDRHPERFNRLILVCPTGSGPLIKRPGLTSAVVHAILRAPIIGTGIFNLIESRRSLGCLLKLRGVYADPAAVTETMLDYYYIAAHQPGAPFAPAAFLSGQLNRDVSAELARLSNPIYVVWGKQASLTPVANAESYLTARPDVRLEVLDGAGLMVADERPSEFVRLVRRELSGM